MLDFFTRIRLYVSVIYVTCLNLGWMFHKIEMLVIVFLLSTTSITAHADTNANPGASPSGLVTFNKMLEFKDLKEIESFGLTYSPKPSPFKSIPDKLVPRLTGKKWSNGKYTVEGKGVYKSGGSCLSYEYKVDLKTRTYTAAPIESYDLDDSYLKLQAMDSNVNRKALKSAQDAGVNVEEMPSEQMDVCQQSPKDFEIAAITAAVSPGTYDNTVSLRTRDLPNWTITRTTDRLKWSVYTNGTVAWQYWYVGWYAVNPSPISTHWYISSKSHGGPYYGAGSVNVSKDVYGAYYNWDWGFDNWATTVAQYVKIQGNNNATYTYWWSHSDAGEDSGFIWGVLTLS